MLTSVYMGLQANQVKAATKDLKNAHERCRKGYTKYIQLHGRATQACSAAGMTVPEMWVPSTDVSLLPVVAAGAAAVPTTPSLQGAAGAWPTSPAKPPLLYSASARILPTSSTAATQSSSSGLPPRRHSSTAPGFESPPVRPLSGTRSGGQASSTPRDANYTDSPTPTTFFNSPPPLPGSVTPAAQPGELPMAAPAPTPFDFASTPRVTSLGGGPMEDGVTPMQKLDLGVSAVQSTPSNSAVDALPMSPPAPSSSSAGQAAVGVTTNPFDESFTSVVTVDLDNAAHIEESIRSHMPTVDEIAAGMEDRPRKSSDSDSLESQAAATEHPDLVAASQPPPALRNPESSPSATSTTSQVSGAPGTPVGFITSGPHGSSVHQPDGHASQSTSGAGASATPVDSHGRTTYPLSANLAAGSLPGTESDLTSMTGRALKSVASGIAVGFAALLPHVPPAGNPHAPNMIVGTANMTTAEVIELRRSAAIASLQAVDEACVECKEAWASHGRCREKFNAQVASALVIFREIEKKRVAEVSDCLRRYTVFVSSLHANLQYDVQRLSAVVEAMGEAPATTTAAVAAFTAPVPNDERLEFARIDQGLISSIASQASASGSSGTASGAVNGATGGPGSRRNSGTGLDAVVRRTSFSSTNDELMSPDGGLVRATSKMFGSLSGIGAALGGAFSHPSTTAGSGAQEHGGHAPELEEGGPDNTPGAAAKPSSAPAVTSAVASETHPAVGLTVTYADPPTPEPAAVRRNSGGSVPVAGPLSSTTSSSQSSTSSIANMGKYFGLRGFGASSSTSTAPTTASAGIAANGTRSTHRPLQSSPLATKAGPTGAPPSGRRSSLQNSPGSAAAQTASGSPGQAHAHPTSNPKGMSVSVSVMGSVRHPNAGAAGMGTRETAAMLEHLHLQPGPVEHLVEALFDPAGAKVTISPDGTLVLLLEDPAPAAVLGSSSSSHGDLASLHGPESGGGESVPQISLDDFTSGKVAAGSGHSSPVGGRSRGGTGASAGLGMGTSGSSSNIAGLSAEGSRPASPAEGRPRAVSVIPLAEASFGALASGGVSTSAADEAVAGAPAVAHAPGRARRSSLAATAALSTGAHHAALNPAVPILLPKVCNALRSEAEALSRLVMALDARRAEGSALSRPSFDALCAVLMSALDGASARQDYPRARSLMVISQTFYCYVTGDEDPEVVDTRVAGCLYEAGLQSSLPNNAPIASSYAFASLTGPAAVDAAAQRPKRVYAQARTRFHSLWQSGQYWESAVYETIGMELAKHGLGLGASGSHGHGSGSNGHSTGGMMHLGFNLRIGGKDSKKAEAEAAAREAELAFGQLGFFAYTMIAFGLPEESVRRLLDKYTRALKLDDAKSTHLGGTVAAFAAESRQMAQAESVRLAKLRSAAQ